MHNTRLYAPDIRHRSTDTPMLVRYFEDGTRFAVARRCPSVRKDTLKVEMVTVIGGERKELRLTEQPDHRLTIGTQEYDFFEITGDRELESCRRVLERAR